MHCHDRTVFCIVYSGCWASVTGKETDYGCHPGRRQTLQVWSSDGKKTSRAMIKRFSPTKVLFTRLIYHRSRKKTRIRGSSRNPTLGRSVSPQPHLLLAHEPPPDLSLHMHQRHPLSKRMSSLQVGERCCGGLSLDLGYL